MKIRKINIDARDGYKLEVHIFKVENEKAVIQIIHGMEEHQERYLYSIRYIFLRIKLKIILFIKIKK